MIVDFIRRFSYLDLRVEIKVPYLNAIGVIEEIPTGQFPVRVLSENFDVYIAKPARKGIPSFELINEFVCSQLLFYWEIPTPEIAAIKVDASLLPENLTARQKKRHYDTVCFGSKYLSDNAMDLPRLISSREKGKRNKILNEVDLLMIGLFDVWVENDDRSVFNPNLMLNPEDGKWKIYAIDHGFAFLSATPYASLDPAYGVIQPYNQSILQTILAKEIWSKMKKNPMITSWSFFADRIARCEKNFRTIVESVPDQLGFDVEMQNKLFSFLFDIERNREVYMDFLLKLG